MGRLTRLLVATVAVLAVLAIGAPVVRGFDGFGATDADATYDDDVTFTVELEGGEPDRLELLLAVPGTEGDFVAEVEPLATGATYRWDTSVEYVTPNTPVTYRWRAFEGERVTVSEPQVVLYDDDRTGLDWRSAAFGEATVHWYGTAEVQARSFGASAADAVARAEALLGTELAGPVDIFVYVSRDEFFGALGPGTREWTGAAAFTELRTIFMWLGGGDATFLERTLLHEITHVVFHDATDNPYHEPARWLNEGVATWSETSDADDERAIVGAEAEDGLFSFAAISAHFPIGERGSRLSYAQGTTMVDMIVDRFGADAVAGIARAYRTGASDEEALEAGTGVPADELYDNFFTEFGVVAPEPVAAEPLQSSTVRLPTMVASGDGGGRGDEQPPVAAPLPREATAGSLSDIVVAVLVTLVMLAAAVTAIAVSRRADAAVTNR